MTNVSETVSETVSTAGKWSSQAGPIQSRKVERVLNAISQQHRTYKELSGVKGVSEHEFSYFSPFGGGSRDDVSAAQTALGDKFGWTITRENWKQIEAEATAALRVLAANLPVLDKRRTVEDEAARDARIRANEAIREQQRAEEAIKNQVRDTTLREIWFGYAPVFRVEMRQIASKAGMELDTVINLWREYAQWSTDADQSAIVSEFQQRYADKLVPALVEPRIVVRNRGHLRQMVEAGRVELVGSYHFDDMLGIERHKGQAMPCAIMPEDRSQRKEGVCYLYESDFTSQVGRWSQGNGNTGCLYVHSNCNYDLRIKPAPAGTEADANDTSPSGITVRRNHEHQGVEIIFPGKPSPDVLARCKGCGFRWSPRSKVWYKRDTGSAWAQAHEIAGLPLPAGESQDHASYEDAPCGDRAYEDACQQATGA